MRHQVAGCKLGRTSSHRNAMFRNMLTSLILRDRIETTLPKAKELRRWADKMITLAKDGSLFARRRAAEVLRDQVAIQKLFSTLVDRYRERHGGYTRIIKLGFRHGDSAPMAVIEYLTAELKKAIHEPKKEEGRKKTARTEKKPKKEAAAKEARPKKKTARPKTAVKTADAKK